MAISKVLFLIPARSGSVSIPHKNIRPLAGLPLMAYRIQSALKLASSQDVWVSTDSQQYADLARKYDATIPFLRPPELSTNDSKSVDMVLHAMDYADKMGAGYAYLALLEPTSPLVTADQLRDVFSRLEAHPEAESIVTTRLVRPSRYMCQKQDLYLSELGERLKNQGIPRRQEEELEVTVAGGTYISKWKAFRQNVGFFSEKTMAYLLEDPYPFEIDEPLDWHIAETILKENLLPGSSI